MSADAQRVQAIFLAAVEIADAAERVAYLERECSADPDLHQQVEALLRAHEAPASILARPITPIDVDRLLSTPTLPLDASADPAPPFTGDPMHDQATRDADAQDHDPSPLELLEPSIKPGSLGRLGHYEVLEVLGQGGFGTVVKAYDEKLQRTIAIKIMSPRLAATSPARKRFMREARSSAAIRHENVVDIHAIDEQPIPFLVMEYVAGETLQERLDRVGPLETVEVLRIGVQIARGLAAAHAMGRIHRDIKPANILLENGIDRVKITDFGLARAADDASLTQSGLIAGTPMYMAPEQAQGTALDQRADLFSFGSVLYVMCSGRPPFRASTTLAVLKRVADDTPRPIREIIPEVPEWLCDIITKLHAKRPAERFQTAQEVADVLGNYLTELQLHGKVQLSSSADSKLQIADCKLKDSPSQSATCNSQSAIRRRRWAVAAAVFLCLLGGLSLTEATGVTNLRATVIRILIPDATLVVETDDPAVKVTVEGDGGLIITGAGLEEIRLRPGSYRVQADRDGKPVPLDKNLVEVTRGGRAIVKVKVEAAAAAASKTEKGAFVRLAAGKERKFDTLAEAVESASDGDTIEVRGNGPFVTQPIKIGERGLTIRAATGFLPVITCMLAPTDTILLLHSRASLVLEGLELHMTAPGHAVTVHPEVGPLHVTNCRFVRNGPYSIISDAPICTIRNCEFVGASAFDAPHVYLRLSSNGKVILENNLISTGRALGIEWARPDLHNLAIHLNHNTLMAHIPVVHSLYVVPKSAGTGAAPDRQPVRMNVSANLFDTASPGDTFSLLLPPDWFYDDAKSLTVDEAQQLLRRLMAWREERNLYRNGISFQKMVRVPKPGDRERASEEVMPSGRTLADWQRLWGSPDSGSMQGVIRYEGGDVLAKTEASPARVAPADFRLRADSAGYGAGKDGKDLGADVELVGPGTAYEGWKKTPQYQQWLKDTGQKK